MSGRIRSPSLNQPPLKRPDDGANAAPRCASPLQRFCEVGPRLSFVAAAQAFGTSHVSKRIALLEKPLGVKLLLRTTRRVSLTTNWRDGASMGARDPAGRGRGKALSGTANLT